MSDATRDECRRAVAASGLTPTAVTHLSRAALANIGLEKLAPVKALLKRFFSDDAWTTHDDEDLTALVGPGEGWWQHDLGERFAFEFGWRDGAFRLELSPLRSDLAATFDGPVVPEATPNPRTIRFITPPIHDGPSRWYESAENVDDPRVARLFADFGDIANVLVGPDFVAVGLRRPDAWEQQLGSVLRVVTDEFASGTSRTASEPEAAPLDRVPDVVASSEARNRALDRAWRDLSVLRLDQPTDVERLLAAVTSTEAAERQAAARVLIGADAELAEQAWTRLLDDRSRSVRRATVDAMVDARRPALRPLLEHALSDGDAWTRWKAVRGLVDLGIEPSRAVVAPHAEDPDFRVRLETARALRAVVVDSTHEEAR